MIGWIYFVASCYIVGTISRIISRSVNLLIKAIINQIKRLKRSTDKIESSEEVLEDVC